MIDLAELMRCPERVDGGRHEWAGTDPARGGDKRNSCRFCGRPGRDNAFEGESGGFFAEATLARTNLIGSLNTRRELTDEQKARAAAIVEDKKRRDAEAVANGTARPGQIAGSKGSRS